MTPTRVAASSIALRVALASVLLAGCLSDHYECKTDADCNIGTGGRCELDRHCTAYDPTCATHRRYTAHAVDDSNVCFAETATLLDACAEGQPPATATGCAAQVCATLPTCCATGWSHACVMAAQRQCDLACDARIALTATKGAKLELWDLRYDGQTWSSTNHTATFGQLLAYVAPAPGRSEPRLAGFTPAGDALTLNDGTLEQDIPVISAHRYEDVASVDFDRDGRDTLALSWEDAQSNDPTAEILKVDTFDTLEIPTPSSVRQSWGDSDRDSYPDAVSETTNRYFLLPNTDGLDHARTLQPLISTAFSGNGTPGEFGISNFDWGDLDGDGALDMVAFGNSLRVHLASDTVFNTPFLNIDCYGGPMLLMINPNATMCDPVNDSVLVHFAGAIRPTATGGELIAATYPTRGLYRIQITRGSPGATKVTALDLGLCTMASCAPFLAVVIRDLDGDRDPDIIAIDAQLAVWASFSKADPTLSKLTVVHQIPTLNDFSVVRASASGAQR